MDPLAVLSGFGVGALVDMTGDGGGSLMTPLLMGAFGLAPAVAIGTDLWFAGLTKVGGTVAHRRLGHVDLDITRRLLWGSLPATALTIGALHLTGAAKGDAPLLTTVLGVTLLLTAATLALRQTWAAWGARLERSLDDHSRARLTVACGALLGVLVTLTSVGAGALGAALLLTLHPRLGASRVIGTDIAHAVPLTLAAGMGHAVLGHVEWALLGALLLGSLPGIWLGARLTQSLPNWLLRGVLCLSLTGAAVKLLV